MKKQRNVGIAVLTRNAKEHLPYCLPPLISSSLKPKILVIDSSSTDNTVGIAKNMGVEVITIPQREFNHGSTREFARKKLEAEIVLMVTQDAYAKDHETVEKLIEPLLEGRASLAYARQIPKPKADLFESLPRLYNYPPKSHVRSLEDLPKYGSYLNFFSDSFGAYLNTALDEIGGFSQTLMGEDTIACAKLLDKGHKVAYQAEATVYHSHNYTILEEFKRHFDIGLFRKEHADYLNHGKDTDRGKQFALYFLKELKKDSYFHLPKGLLHLGAKFLGYKIGSKAKNWPLLLKKQLSSQKYYWNK